jgi:cytochrome o ubiquinol oxidase operon protein cyoD
MTKTFDVIDEKFEASRKAMRSYVTGFILSLLCTIIPYCMVTGHLAGDESLLLGVTFFGVAQLFVQVFFFLHLPAKQKPYWDIIVFVFTLLIVAFLVVGSLWIMYHLNYNMMGVSPFHSNEGYVPQ